MSTTRNLAIAVKYSTSASSVLFRLKTRSSMERGADIAWLSCFPGEQEFLYPPLTYMQPVKVYELVLLGHAYTVLEVEPR